jgi:DNA-binding winged helix-turn-helix (wHTH) protein
MDQLVADPLSSTVSLADSPDFMIRDLSVRPALRLIEHGTERHVVQPRVMQVLVALARAAPEVVSRDRLVTMCWDGRVVGDDALNRCIVMLRSLGRDLGDAFRIENVARVGYRMVVTDTGDDGVANTVASSVSRKTLLWMAGAALVAVTAAAGWFASRDVMAGERASSASPAARKLVEDGNALLRTGNPQVAGDARSAFEKAVEASPSFAEAWVGLGRSLRAEASLEGPERIIVVLPAIRERLQRAIAINPELASAHFALAEAAGMDSPEAQSELVRAFRLDPASAEAQLGMASVHRARGHFQAELAGYRRARALDSNWYRPVRDQAIASAEMGDRKGAVRLATTITFGSGECAGPQARIALIYGDIARSARCNADGTKVETIWRAPARVAYQSALLAMGLATDPLAAAPLHVADARPPQGRVWMTRPPTPGEWRHRNRSADAALAYRLENFVAAKMLLAEGRSAELVRTYDSPTGLIGLKRGMAVSAATLPAAPIVALALREEGRGAEANAILRSANEAIAAARRHGEVPFTFDAEAATVHAAAGEIDLALSALERARRRGWVNVGWGDMLDLGQEPALRSLRGEPRFEAICAELKALYARERRTFLATRD